MSLTNPNKIVTEQRLNEYHQTILPYLGGMPEMVANKFSKGDLYSTEERLIGCWIDGKPLYQKTISCGAMPNATSKTVNHNIANIDTIVNISGVGMFSSGTAMPLPIVYDNTSTNGNFTTKISVSKTTIDFLNNGDRTNISTSYVTIQYTKTTDSAVNYGSADDYSTTEKVVGTWIDGKPIYQKTIDCGALTNATEKQISHNIDNLDMVVNAQAFSKRSTDGVMFPLPYAKGNPNSTTDIQISFSVGVAEISIHSGNDRRNFTRTYATLQYTKTTD